MISNVYWVGNLNVIGGVETAIYELAKMFQDYDFVVYYNSIPSSQLKRLKRYVKCIKYKGEPIKCKKFFCNYDISIIDNVEAEEYIEIVHCVFKHNVLKPHTHEKITKYYAVGKEACDSFKEITGKECEVLHNPLQIDKPRKVLKLISATRLASDKGKLVQRMQRLVNELEVANIPYIWNIFTNGEHLIKGKGVIYLEPRTEIRDYIADADYLVQLSDTEAFCYSVLESLYLCTPVIVTPIPCFEEMGVKQGVNGYILDFDMNNIPICDIYKNIPKFSYQPLDNKWYDIIEKEKGNYKEELQMKVKVKALINFNDLEENVKRVANKSEWICSKERAEFLLEHKAVEVLQEIKEDVEHIIPLANEDDLNKLSEAIIKNVKSLEDPYKDYDVEKAFKKSNKKKTSKK